MRCLEKQLAEAVTRRRQDGTARFLRVLPPSNVDFCSNDYLGLSRNARLAALIRDADVDPTNGSTGSRLITGHSPLHAAVEDELAAFYGTDAALVFNSGYLANLSIMSSVPQPTDVVLFDALVHNSCREGLRLCRAKTVESFRHNDLTHLEAQLKRYASPTANTIVVVESVYSMDGDVTPLLALVTLCEAHGASVIVDEAHSTAVMGPRGAGLVRELNLQHRVLCTVFTFGKGMGIHGAVVCSSPVLKEYLINYARPFIYSTSLPAHDMYVIQCAHRVCADSDAARADLLSLISHFRARVGADPAIPPAALLPSDTAIQGLLFQGNEAALAAAAFLGGEGFNVVAIRAPTVPANAERLRIILHAFNTYDEVDRLVAAVGRLFRQRQSAL
ncbi:Aste57867_7181 [Aphanomyces stellatus]|uniref:Aste57867_7181 protein n=1 Tax=Aphanomyces stellatus TaxID=120398 RepID=A0A485KG77_9STRA|nr:hypothetical protein As57867_007156 [Aphanomyces stellatus]VFT84109.1 Aste57867_7181 [Aphanomyces stellatus]